MTIKNLIFPLFVSILIVSCDNINSKEKDKDKKEKKDKDKKEFKDICDCTEWFMDKSEEILDMTNSEIRDEFEDYDSWDEYTDELHPECEDLAEEWGEEWKEENEGGSRAEAERDFKRYLKNECDVRWDRLMSMEEEVEEKFNRALSGGSKREENSGSGRDYGYDNRNNYNDPCDCFALAIEVVQELNNLDDFELSQIAFENENFLEDAVDEVMYDSGCSDLEGDYDDCAEYERYMEECFELGLRLGFLEEESSYDDDYEFDFE